MSATVTSSATTRHFGCQATVGGKLRTAPCQLLRVFVHCLVELDGGTKVNAAHRHV
ncbi:MAG: hypothetical protein JOZ09_13480 [Pseudonocardiales bacterium]|nr:hypothetical protein [Pseudonocardiales bacterium]